MRLVSCLILLAGTVAFAADDFKPEAGFTLLFNGKDLSGWKEKGKAGKSLDGKTEAFKGRFKVVDGAIVIDPSVKGDVRIETVKQFGKDAVIRFEFKPDAKCNNDLFLLGTKFDLRKGVKGMRENEWNQIEIAAKGSTVDFTVNGTPAGSLKSKGEKSPFEIRAEFGGIEIRKLRAKE
jgi:hypothetical protein